MAEPGQAKSLIRSAVMALVVLSLVPLTLKVGWNLLMLPTKFPMGWPEELGKQLWGIVVLGLALLSVVSVAVAWWLGVRGVRQGWAWIRERPLWLRLTALLAPALFLAAAVVQFIRFQQLRQGANAGEMPAAYWSTLAWTYGIDLLLATLFLLALAALRFVPPPRTG